MIYLIYRYLNYSGYLLDFSYSVKMSSEKTVDVLILGAGLSGKIILVKIFLFNSHNNISEKTVKK